MPVKHNQGASVVLLFDRSKAIVTHLVHVCLDYSTLWSVFLSRNPDKSIACKKKTYPGSAAVPIIQSLISREKELL